MFSAFPASCITSFAPFDISAASNHFSSSHTLCCSYLSDLHCVSVTCVDFSSRLRFVPLCLLSVFCVRVPLLTFSLSGFLSHFFLVPPSPSSPPAGSTCTVRLSEPAAVCAVHPPASHSAPSFLRQYASHLGRTALQRGPGGGLERDRAYLSLHRTGSLGTHTHTRAQ